MSHKRSFNFLKTLLIGSAVSVTAMAASPAMAAYPDKPITIVVPFSPGGSTDQIGRMIAQHFSDQFKVAVVVDNRPGASGIEEAACLVVPPQSTAAARQFLVDQRKGWSKLISEANVEPM